MIVVFTQQAERQLEAIADYIAQEHPSRAAAFVEALIERCVLLAEHPYAFPLVPRFESRGIRRRRYANYLIFFRVRAAQIDILHVLHGARDYESVLFGQT